MFLKKVEAASGLSLEFETDIEKVTFTIDGMSQFYTKRNLPKDTDDDYIKAKGILKWSIKLRANNDGLDLIEAFVPENQKLQMEVSYYVGEEGNDTELIQEEIVLKNVQAEIDTRHYLSTTKNKLILDLRIEEVVWDEDYAFIKIIAGGD